MPETNAPLLTTSERRAFKRCPARWYWEYRQGLRASEAAPALWFGIGIHEALAHYYGNLGYIRNLDFVDVWNTYCDEDEMSKVIRTRPFDDAEEQWVDAKALGAQMLRGHHEKWGGDPDWDVIAIERPFQIEIPDPADPAGTLALFTSTWDGVKRDRNTKRIGLMEHKTAKAISTGHLPMDDQGGSYWTFATMILRHEGVLGKRETIDEITYNFLKKAMPDDRPKDAEGYATNKPLKAHYVDQMTAVAAMYEDFRSITGKEKIVDLEAMAKANNFTVLGERSSIQPGPLYERHPVQRNSAQRRTQVQNIQRELIAMAPLRDNGVPYKNPTRDCSWDCPFYTMCELHDSGADWEEFRDGIFWSRDPYDRYRKSASEGL